MDEVFWRYAGGGRTFGPADHTAQQCGRCVLRRSRSSAPAPLQPEFPPQPLKAA